MLTPVFRCRQDCRFVIVDVVLSPHCKPSEMQLDLHGAQFTLFVSPCYLRLVFAQPLTEGRGERAIFDFSTNLLTVFLPKLNEGEEFTHLDDTAFLIATEKQRRKWVIGVEPLDEPVVDNIEETEYVQTLPVCATIAEEFRPRATYGIAAYFSSFFDGFDDDLLREVTHLHHLRQLERCPPENQRSPLRLPQDGAGDQAIAHRLPEDGLRSAL